MKLFSQVDSLIDERREKNVSLDDLIELAKNGDHQAFHELIERHILSVERFAFQIGVSANDVEDVTQEVFIRVYRFLKQYSGKTFTTWLYKITLNVARDYYKKAKRNHEKLDLLARESSLIEENLKLEMFMNEEDEKLHLLIQQLDDKYKLPLILYYFQDQKIKEISTILSLPVSTVKTRLFRARAKLKKALQANGGDVNVVR